MAKYEHPPIYLATYNLTLHMYGVVNGFSLLHRYGRGSELTAL